MAIDERQRHGLYQKLEATIGDEHADTLMSMLPPVGWADVATKQDLEKLELRIEASMARLEARIQEAMRHQAWAIVGVILVSTLASLWLGR
jgi:hypothetical protein